MGCQVVSVSCSEQNVRNALRVLPSTFTQGLPSHYWSTRPGKRGGMMTSEVVIAGGSFACAWLRNLAAIANATISVINGLADPIKHPTHPILARCSSFSLIHPQIPPPFA